MKKWKMISTVFREEGFRGCFLFLRYGIVLDCVSFLTRLIQFDASKDPSKVQFDNFVEEVNRLDNPRILELGSRNISHKSLFKNHSGYVGFDINPGLHVDVVGDIHQLSEHFPENHFDVVYCVSVFEHLAMPWKAVLEINRVLKKGGLLFVFTHPTFPPHAEPWDFWRFSKSAFSALLNRKTGFEIVNCTQGLPCVVLPIHNSPSTRLTHRVLCFMAVTVLARKVEDPDSLLIWNMRMEEVALATYPLKYFDEVKNVFFSYVKDRKE